MKCKRSSDGRSLDHHTLQQMRMQAVKAVREGAAVPEVARAYGMNPRTIYRWLADFVDGGQQALLAKEIPGRPAKLSADELRWIARTVRDETPQQRKFPYGLWTLSLIETLIARQFGKKLATSTVWRAMRLLGFTAQKPLYRAWQQDAELVRRWEAEVYPAIRAQAKAEGAQVYFADESGIRSDYHSGTTWAPAGQTPVVSVTGRRFGLNMISAVAPGGEIRFMVHEGSVTATVFRDFLKRLLIGTTRPVYVIVDGHPIHRARLVQRFVASTDGQLKLFTLPPYAPHLNPDEAVWGHVKRNIARSGVQNLDQLKSLALGALRSLQKLPHIVRGFFRQPECQYILE